MTTRTWLIEPSGMTHPLRDPPSSLLSLCGRRGWPRGSITTQVPSTRVCPTCAAVLAGGAAPVASDVGSRQGRLF